MNFYFSLLEIYKSEEQWWFGICGISLDLDYGNSHLFYIEWDMGYWKFDLFYLRNFILDRRNR